MGKKRLRAKRTSKGVHSTMDRGVVQAMRAGRDAVDVGLGKIQAWKKGLNPWLTVASLSKAEKNNKPFTRVRANDYWGKPNAGWSLRPSQEAIDAAG